MTGELYPAGAGVARGCVGRPAWRPDVTGRGAVTSVRGTHGEPSRSEQLAQIGPVPADWLERVRR
ncbi:hypothetical protein K2224_20180 [Streptomyces sp. BHT-5-2]|uniref:hypothetical protein n=1 Tax=unclassified Streptomyces TaxID=2593676 RepID=UPI001C8E3F13|nr:hypothetical protein [Streptomyces sp. BHT-5-2]QZL07130.1 hypothetical protein K2224_20180 [Streptomyces sp. BHT-5-2]